MEKLKDTSVKITEMCPSCGKRRDGSSRGSLTSWLFRKERCSCDAMKPASSEQKPKAEDYEAKPTTKALVDLGTRYEVLSLIGQGGMGSVYKVMDLTQNKLVAVKVLRPELVADKVAVTRFEHEARTAMGFKHPNLVSVSEYGVTASGLHFLSMEYLDGVGLDSYLLDKGMPSTMEALNIFMQVCDGLAYIHDKQMVHRDMKPSNVILTQLDSKIKVKILDFGIAKVFTESMSQLTSQLTQTGELLGSPPYMSPEQCSGNALDARSDIYSLGCMMYQIIAGTPPFMGDNPVRTIMQHISEKPQDFTKRGLSVPKDLSAIVIRCLEKHPDDRYASAMDLQDDLRNFMEHKPLSKRVPFARSRRFIKKRYRELGASAILLALLTPRCCQMLESAFNTMPLDAQWQKLDLQGQQMFDHGKYKEAEEFFDRELQIARESKDSKLVLASLNEILDLRRAEKKPTTEITAEINKLKPDKSFSQDILKELSDKLDSASGIETDKAKRARIQRLLNDAVDTGSGLFSQGELDQAEKIYETAKQLCLKTLGSKDRVIFRATGNLGQVAHERGEYEKAIACYEEAIKLAPEIMSADDPVLARAYMELGRVYSQTSRNLDRAEELLSESRRINVGKYGPNCQQVAWSKYQLSILYAQTGDLERARSTLKSAITIYESDANADQNQRARCYAQLGVISANVGYCEKALDIFESKRDKDYMFLCQDLTNLAEIYGSSAPDQAEFYLKRAEAILPRFSKETADYMNAYIIRTRGFLHLKLKRPTEAETAFKTSLEIQEKFFGKDKLECLHSITGLAISLADSKPKVAETYFKKGLNIIEKSHKNLDELPYIAKTLCKNYEDFLKKQHRSKDAESLRLRLKSISGDARQAKK